MRTTIVLTVSAMLGATVFIRARSRRRRSRRMNCSERIPQAANIRSYMQRLSARPHHVGSAYDKDNAEWMLAKFKEWGWDAEIEQLRRALPDAEGARARAGRADEVHGEARRAGGRVRSDDRPEDRAAAVLQRVLDRRRRHRAARVRQLRPRRRLRRSSIASASRSAARSSSCATGRSSAASKPKIAFEHGAVGCLIYSDPKDDGFARARCFRTARCARPTACSAASVEDLASGGRRSADDRHRRGARRTAYADQRIAGPHEDSRCCRFRTATRSRCWRR